MTLGFSFSISWIQALREKEEAMNTIWKIAVQQVALFTVLSFLEVAEIGKKRHETHDLEVLAERTEGLGILLEIPARISVYFFVYRFCRLLYTLGVNV